MSVIVQKGSGAYGSLVSLRPLLAMLVAFAMLFAPLSLQSGAAMAMAPADHHSQKMKSDHCGEQPSKSQDGKSMDKPCCAAMCAAAAVTALPSVEPQIFARMVQRPALDLFHHSFLAELPTPPPRLA